MKQDELERLGFEKLPSPSDKKPLSLPAVPQRAIKNAFTRLRGKKAKAQIFLKAIQFAGQLVGIG